jgi:hypothetical protein
MLPTLETNAIKKGSKIVVNLYTDSREKLEMLAKLPVPKNATLMNIRKKPAIRRSERAIGRFFCISYIRDLDKLLVFLMLIYEKFLFKGHPHEK